MKKLTEKLKFSDNITNNGIWATTEVIGGYGEIHNTPNGKSTLDEEIFRTKNIVPIGGVSYVMEQMFGVKDSQIDVPTVYTTDSIGIINSGTPSETYDVPGGTKTPMYRYGHYVQLFGVGITGTAENAGKDHSVFIGFAPMDEPKIAISVYIEHGGFGADVAAPIAGLVMEKYLKGKLSSRSQAMAKRIERINTMDK